MAHFLSNAMMFLIIVKHVKEFASYQDEERNKKVNG